MNKDGDPTSTAYVRIALPTSEPYGIDRARGGCEPPLEFTREIYEKYKVPEWVEAKFAEWQQYKKETKDLEDKKANDFTNWFYVNYIPRALEKECARGRECEASTRKESFFVQSNFVQVNYISDVKADLSCNDKIATLYAGLFFSRLSRDLNARREALQDAEIELLSDIDRYLHDFTDVRPSYIYTWRVYSADFASVGCSSSTSQEKTAQKENGGWHLLSCHEYNQRRSKCD